MQGGPGWPLTWQGPGPQWLSPAQPWDLLVPGEVEMVGTPGRAGGGRGNRLGMCTPVTRRMGLSKSLQPGETQGTGRQREDGYLGVSFLCRLPASARSGAGRSLEKPAPAELLL